MNSLAVVALHGCVISLVGHWISSSDARSHEADKRFPQKCNRFDQYSLDSKSAQISVNFVPVLRLKSLVLFVYIDFFVLSQFATAGETTQRLPTTAVNRGPMNCFGWATMLSQTATAVAKLDAAHRAQAWPNAVNSTQVIDKKAYRQAGTLCVLLTSDVSLASVSGSMPTVETIKTISHNNKNAPCEVRR
jgi:hypothetical protein